MTMTRQQMTRAMFTICAPVVLALLAACGSSDSTTVPPVTPPITPPVATLPTCSAVISANAPLTDISTVQGASTTSALLSQTVTVRGVVVGEFQNQTGTPTVTKLNGFFMQQVVPDADPLTSEGIFVFAPNAAKVTTGDYVQVQGQVAEFGAAGSTITQLAGTVTVSVCGSGVAVTPTQVTLPVASDSALERYEGMLVEFTQPLAAVETFQLGQFGQMVLALNGRQFNPTNGNATATAAQNRLERIVLDDGSSASNPNPTPYLSAAGSAGTRRVGDTVQKLTGILSHGFGAYRVQATVAPVFVQTNARPVAPPSLTGDIKVSSFNVLNYFTTLQSENPNARGANTAAEFARQEAKIVEAIAGLNADVLGLEEIENNNDVATQKLVAALNAKLGAGTYASVNSGKFGTDVIKVDMLYKPAKVKRIGGTVLPTGADLANYVAPSGRPPLAQRFASVANNGSFWFVVNHFKSKGCGSPATTTDPDVGQGCFNLARTAQANALNSFVAKLQASGESDVLIMGDINSYLLEDPTKALEAAGNESLLKRLPASDRYTYVFNGETGALDHGYASSTLKSQVTGVGVWHINADEPTVLDYNTEFRTDDRYAPTPYRASDHDPVLVALTLSPDAAADAPVLNINVPSTGTASIPLAVTITDALPGGSATLTDLSINWGDSSPVTSLTAAGGATHTYTAAGTYTVVVTLTNSAAQSVSKSVAISIAAAAAPPLPVGAPDLFFSEYIEGSSNNKALEIYNPTTATVSLSSYTVKLYTNGTTTVSNIYTLTGTLAPGAVVVLVNASAAAPFQTTGSFTTTVTFFNGDDAITLEKSGAVIDRFGQLGFDPGTQWLSGGIGTQDRTLRRKPNVRAGDPNATAVFDPALQWDGFAIDDATDLGRHTVTP